MRTRTIARPRPCLQCGKSTTAGYKFCGAECRRAHTNAGRLQRHEYLASVARPETTCRHCAEKFTPKRADRTAFCSRACAFSFRSENAQPKFTSVHSCKACGKWGRRTICDLTCDRKYKTARARALSSLRNAPTPKTCRGCGVQFSTVYGHSHARYCGVACAIRNGRAGRRRRLRKARVIGVVVGRIAVFERDGWRCHWCKEETPREFIGSVHPRAPVLDHVMPISRGGRHTPDNVVCACNSCNSKKGNAMPSEFLRRTIAAIDAQICHLEALAMADAAR